HHHWHLQRAAKYSLWNSAKTAEVAPAQKVGFCLDDSQHVETTKGPSTPVYADNVAPFRAFCQQYKPNATSLFEGISPGWRDLYSRELAFQWVDASNVLPGEYWLREEVNPLGVIKETGGENVPVYAASPTIIPGFDALPQALSTANGEAKSITLSAKAWNDAATPTYKIVTQPTHGTLSAISSGKVTYTPNAGYSGSDSLTFSAADPSSQFPTSPAVATVSLEVGEAGAPSVAIEGAPESLTVGTSVQLAAHVSNDSPTVTWAASAGTITQAGLYSAPAEVPSGGTVTVSATTSKGAKDQKTIKVTAVAPSKTLLAGDATSTYAVADKTSAGREEAFQFTAKSSGTVEELQFRTNATADTGLTGLSLGVFADNAGKPGEVLGKATFTGTPATSSWIAVKGLSTTLVSGTKYWLVALPLGPSGKGLFFSAAVVSGGTGNVESTATGLTGITPESAWESYGQGPVGFQAMGIAAGAGANLIARGATSAASVAPAFSTKAAGSSTVAIAGAQSSMTAGTSAQLSALVAGDSPSVSWSASAGSISQTGLFTAPSRVPASGSATVRATTSHGGHDELEIAIAPVTSPRPAPLAPLPNEPAGAAGSSLGTLQAPAAMRFNNEVIITAEPVASGRLLLGVYAGRRRLGGCTVRTPAGRTATCRVALGHLSVVARLSVRASLQTGRRTLHSSRVAAAVPSMSMAGMLPGLDFSSATAQYLCSPAFRPQKRAAVAHGNSSARTTASS
ncbi:MAG TPA: Ig-like domain-containing protein, partial [Solirubrobacteraceae bacterium]